VNGTAPHLREIEKRDGIAVGKLDGETKLAGHRLDVGAKRRKQEVAAFFDPRHPILRNVQGFGHALSRWSMSLAQVAQRHFFLDEPRRLRLDLALSFERRPLDHFVQCSRHVSLSFLSGRADRSRAAFLFRSPIGINSLFWRFNSLLARIGFPVVVELIPCSVAQGISSRRSHKRLDSQMFS
jgi:hypothetical protein